MPEVLKSHRRRRNNELITGLYDKEDAGLALFAGAVDCPAVEPPVIELMSGRVKGRTLPAITAKLDRVFVLSVSGVERPVKDNVDWVGVHFALDLCLFVFGHSIVDSLDRLAKWCICLEERWLSDWYLKANQRQAKCCVYYCDHCQNEPFSL